MGITYQKLFNYIPCTAKYNYGTVPVDTSASSGQAGSTFPFGPSISRGQPQVGGSFNQMSAKQKANGYQGIGQKRDSAFGFGQTISRPSGFGAGIGGQNQMFAKQQAKGFGQSLSSPQGFRLQQGNTFNSDTSPFSFPQGYSKFSKQNAMGYQPFSQMGQSSQLFQKPQMGQTSQRPGQMGQGSQSSQFFQRPQMGQNAQRPQMFQRPQMGQNGQSPQMFQRPQMGQMGQGSQMFQRPQTSQASQMYQRPQFGQTAQSSQMYQRPQFGQMGQASQFGPMGQSFFQNGMRPQFNQQSLFQRPNSSPFGSFGSFRGA
jgi:hypothetical protein